MNLDFNIESKKLALIQWLTSLNDVSMIDKILELKQKETKDWWNEISDEEKRGLWIQPAANRVILAMTSRNGLILVMQRKSGLMRN